MLSPVATSSSYAVSSDSPDPVPVAATLGCADGETRQPEKRAQGLEGACAGVEALAHAGTRQLMGAGVGFSPIDNCHGARPRISGTYGVFSLSVTVLDPQKRPLGVTVFHQFN